MSDQEGVAISHKTLIIYILIAMIASLTTNFGVDYYQARKRAEHIQESELGQIIRMIEKRYVDDVSSQQLMEDAINGMLTELDPYSEYLKAERYDDLVVHTQGEFGGLGIRIAIRDDVLTVIAPIEGTPAKRLGIRAGDQIIAVDGEPTLDWTVLEAVEHLRGKKGTIVSVTIRRPGQDEPIDFAITRDIITIDSVPYSFMLNDNIGYIRLVEFSERTGTEMRQALQQLRQQGAQRIVLDLRDNPGGLLEAAIDVADEFLNKGELIVYTKGRTRDQNREFVANRSLAGDPPLLAVLVNQGSASASEIVAGAIQDHDLGLIIGKPTFGKGSVQTVYQLSANRAIKLTTAKYYTPSGRCIHKDHSRTDADSAAVASTAGGDSTRVEFTTTLGRIVYGGGGITPDVEVDYIEYTRLVQDIARKGLFFNFTVDYLTENNIGLAPIDAATIAAFKQAVKKAEVDFTDTEFGESLPQIKRELQREIAAIREGDSEAYRLYLAEDPQLNQALSYLLQAHSTTSLLQFAAVQNQTDQTPEN